MQKGFQVYEELQSNAKDPRRFILLNMLYTEKQIKIIIKHF